LSKSSATAAHYMARAILLAGFAFYIVHLVQSGNLNLYIAIRMQLIVKLSALGMYAVAAQQLYAAIRTWFDERRHEHDLSCDCDLEMPSTWGKSLLLYGWFAIPLIIGFTVPDGLLGSSMATAKGVQFTPKQIVKPVSKLPSVSIVPKESASESPSVSEPTASDSGHATDAGKSLEKSALDLLFPSDEFTASYAKFGKQLVKQDLIRVTDKQFIETLTTLDLYRKAFIGKTIQLSGFIYREGSMGIHQFGVSRFAISCCSADASPYGVMANFDKADTLATDEWVRVTGKLGTMMYNGNEIIKIDVSKVTKITPPKDAYVSPDLDFGL
jgi:putative membrane protein